MSPLEVGDRSSPTQRGNAMRTDLAATPRKAHDARPPAPPLSPTRGRRCVRSFLAAAISTIAFAVVLVADQARAVVCANGGAGDRPAAGADGGLAGNAACGQGADARS